MVWLWPAALAVTATAGAVASYFGSEAVEDGGAVVRETAPEWRRAALYASTAVAIYAVATNGPAIVKALRR